MDASDVITLKHNGIKWPKGLCNKCHASHVTVILYLVGIDTINTHRALENKEKTSLLT